MMRFLGVIVGSTIAVAALVVFVGIPEFTTESSVAEPTVITLPMRAETPEPEPVTEAPQEVEQATVMADPPAQPAPVADTPAEAPPIEPVDDTPVLAPQAALQWYAFWSPFRSEVAFAYEDDQDITVNLSQISAATGLRLPEG